MAWPKSSLFAGVAALLLLASLAACPGDSPSPELEPTAVVVLGRPTPTFIPPTQELTSAPLCDVDDLDVGFDFNQGATGNWIYLYRVTNISSEPCSVENYPEIVFSEGSEPAIVAIVNTTSGDRQLRTVALRPGESAGGNAWTPTEVNCDDRRGVPRGAVRPASVSYYTATLSFTGGSKQVDLHAQKRGIYPHCGVQISPYRKLPPR